MPNRTARVSLVVLILSLVGVSIYPVLIVRSVRVQTAASQTLKDNAELKRLHDDDQSDRTPKDVDRAIVSRAIKRGCHESKSFIFKITCRQPSNTITAR